MVAQAPPVKQQAGATCPGPMTRAALLALRSAGTLNTSCHYVVTDYVEGRFLTGTTITLHAVAVNELSEQVQLNSLYDNEAWSARYDIDRNTLLEVSDNQGNVVRSNVTGRVASWDWGNPNITNNTSDGANVLFTYGATRNVSGNTFGTNATISLTGWFSGSLTDTEVSGGSSLLLTNSAGTIIQSRILSLGTVNLTGYTGGSSILRSTIENGATVNFSNSTVAHSVANCTINGAATSINSASVTTAGATLSMTGSEVAYGGLISRNGAVSPMTFNYSRVIGNASTITQTVGQLSCTGVSLQDYGRILMDAAAGSVVGVCTINYSTISGGGSYVRHWGRSTLSVSGADITSAAAITTAVNSNTATSIQNTTVTSSGSITVDASATAGTFNVTNTHILSNGSVTRAGTGSLSVSGSTFIGSGRIQQQTTNVRNMNLTNVTCSNVGRILQGSTAGAGVTDAIAYTSIDDYGVINLTATGAASNQINYSSVRGLTGTVTIQGTNTGAALSRLTVDNGTVAFTSNVAMPTILGIGVRDQGAWTVQNCTAARDMRYSTIQSYSRWLFNGCTVAAPSYGVTLQSQGNLTHSGAAGAANGVLVELSGTIAHNGGALANAYKRMTGTLTTGAFTHTNIGHEAAVSKTLTANNASRVDYQGLAAQLV